MILAYKANTLDFNDDMNELLCNIDKKISQISMLQLNSKRYGASVCINWNDFFRLNKYRELLELKAKNNICVKDFFLDDILSRIKQILNRN
jgi:hypothetical protein